MEAVSSCCPPRFWFELIRVSFILFLLEFWGSLSVCVQVVRASRQVAERRSGGQLRAVRASPAAASRHALCTQAQAAGGSSVGSQDGQAAWH